MTQSNNDIERDALEADQIALPRFGAGTRQNLVSSEDGQLSLNDENLAAIAHDLRGPLAIVELETQHLGTVVEPLGLATVESSLARIHKNVAFMARLVDDVLDLARAEAGRLRLNLQPQDIGEVLGGVIERAISTRDRDRIVLELLDTAVVRIDSARIERVVENLVRNAFADSPPASPIVVRLEVRNATAWISVIDSGPGLTPEEMHSVFLRYWLGPGTRGERGQGLGLHVSRKIAEAHGGRLDVESVLGSGSRFFLELPTIRG